jgi:type IV pilus assembly protein PilC
MAEFQYVAKSKGGQDVRAMISAVNRLEALEELRRQDLTVIDLIRTDPLPIPQIVASDQTSADKSVKKSWTQKSIALSAAVKLGDIAVFCRQLAISVTAGVPLRDALDMIGRELENPTLQHAVLDMSNQLRDGKNLSAAAATYPKIFNVMFCGLIRVAEESGKLPETLRQLSDYLEKTDKLQRRVKAMASYPAFIGIFFVLVCTAMSLFILPKFIDIFSGFGSDLPPFTQAVFSINTFFVDHFFLILIGVAMLVTALVLYGRTDAGAFRNDRLKLAMPGLGELLKKYVMARFCRSLSIMVHSGVSISTALEICADAAGNRVIRKAVQQARERIMTGQRISESFSESGIFPGLITRMVAIGEDSGQLPEVLDRVSELYEDQVETKIMSTMALFEPLVICLFGGVVMILVMAIYLPIISVSSAVK